MRSRGTLRFAAVSPIAGFHQLAVVTLQLFAMKALLRGTSQLLFVIAGLLFFVGGRVISAFTKTDRVMAEMMNIGLAFVLGIFGMVAKNAADNFDDENSLR